MGKCLLARWVVVMPAAEKAGTESFTACACGHRSKGGGDPRRP